MGCETETGESEDMDEALPSMWPEDMNDAGRKFNIERPGADQDMLEDVTFSKEPDIIDFHRLMELTDFSDKGNRQLANMIKDWEYKQGNAVRLLREELDDLSRRQREVEHKKLEILEEHDFERDACVGDRRRPISILDEDMKYFYQDSPGRRRSDVVSEDKDEVEVDAEYGCATYWKQRALQLEKLLEASVDRERALMEKLRESMENLERQSSPIEELSQVLKRADNFLHFALQNAPVVIGHQDKDLRYRFIFNHFPSLGEQDIIGKTDVEIYSGLGVKESHDFKREVLDRGLPAKREITFETELFGSKTFLIYVEPVFSKTGETIGINYIGMEVTDQVRKREKIAKLREEMAVQKAQETELNKTIHITEESMRAKQMLATMSHEIRSPLSGVVSVAEILSTTNLDKEQRQLLKVMLFSGDLVLQLINDILDLSKVESGVMKLEATKFRPREVVNHVLQTAAASLQKILTLEGHVADDVPIEVIGDVLRIRQILTNLVSNAIKFTQEGKVGINIYVIQEPSSTIAEQDSQKVSRDQSKTLSANIREELPTSVSQGDRNSTGNGGKNGNCENNGDSVEEDEGTNPKTVVWIRCDVYDTGIGIPENAIPSLFKKYMQAGADTARKYGGTGLGLAICKQLVELMGGHLTVSSVEHHGSTFTFVLPYKVPSISDNSDDPDELSNSNVLGDGTDDDLHSGVFLFQPRTLATSFSSQASGRIQKLAKNSYGFDKFNELLSDDSSSPTSNITYKEITTRSGDASSAMDTAAKHEKSRNAEVNGPLLVRPINIVRGNKTSDENITTHEVRRGWNDENSECSSSGSPEITRTDLKPKILLVEDNKINVMVMQSMMKKFGHDIDVVHDGAEAVRAVQSNDYCLVLMDVCMPVMDGIQATRLIRSYEETGTWDEAVKAGVDIRPLSPNSCSYSQLQNPRKRIPIVAMTANAMSESANECYANGMDSFVTKPITFQKLKQCLQQYVP